MSQENVETVARLYNDCWGLGKLELVPEILHPDIVWTAIESAPDSGTRRGQVECRAYMNDWLESFDLKPMPIEEARSAPDGLLVCALHGVGTEKRTGLTTDIRYGACLPFRTRWPAGRDPRVRHPPGGPRSRGPAGVATGPLTLAPPATPAPNRSRMWGCSCRNSRCCSSRHAMARPRGGTAVAVRPVWSSGAEQAAGVQVYANSWSGLGCLGSYRPISPAPGILKCTIRPQPSSSIGDTNSTPLRSSSATVCSMS